jgi:hypothetical protein
MGEGEGKKGGGARWEGSGEGKGDREKERADPLACFPVASFLLTARLCLCLFADADTHKREQAFVC